MVEINVVLPVIRMLPDLPLELVETVLMSLGLDARPGELVLACGKATAAAALRDPRFVAACTTAGRGRIDLSSVIEDNVARGVWTDLEASLAVTHLLRFVKTDLRSMFVQATIHQLLAMSCRHDLVKTLRSSMVGLCFSHASYTTVDQMLVSACDAGSVRCVKALVEEHQADVQYAHGMPLWRALLRERSCSGTLVRYLIGRGALPRLSVVHAAGALAQGDVMSLLLQLIPPAVMAHLSPQFLSTACSVGNPEAVNVVLDATGRSLRGLIGHDDTCDIINSNHGSALTCASANGHAEVVRALLRRGADADIGQGRAMRTACSWGRAEVVKVLLDAGADVHVLDDRPIVDACVMGHFDVARVLMEHSAATGHVWHEASLVLAMHWALAFGQTDVYNRMAAAIKMERTRQ
jgi:hypothetical protein